MSSPVVMSPLVNSDFVYYHSNSVVYLNGGYPASPSLGIPGVQVQGGAVAKLNFQPVPEPEPGTMCLVMGHGNHLHKGQSWKDWNAEYFETLRYFFDKDLQHREWVKKVVILVDSDIPGVEYHWWLHELFGFLRALGGRSEMVLRPMLKSLQVVVRSRSELSTQQRWAQHGSSISTMHINRAENGSPTGAFTTEYSWPVDCMKELEAIATSSTLDSLALQNPIYPIAFLDNYDNFSAHVINALKRNKNIRRLDFTLDLARSFGPILRACSTLKQLSSLTIRVEHPMTAQSADPLKNRYGGLPSRLVQYISSFKGLQYLDIPGFLASQRLYTVLDRMISFPVLIVDGRPIDFHAVSHSSLSGPSSSLMQF